MVDLVPMVRNFWVGGYGGRGLALALRQRSCLIPNQRSPITPAKTKTIIARTSIAPSAVNRPEKTATKKAITASNPLMAGLKTIPNGRKTVAKARPNSLQSPSFVSTQRKGTQAAQKTYSPVQPVPVISAKTTATGAPKRPPIAYHQKRSHCEIGSFPSPFACSSMLVTLP